MHELLKYWKYTYYTSVVTFLLATLGLIVSIWKEKKNPKLKPMFFFFLGYVLNQLISYSFTALKVAQPLQDHVIFYTDFIDTIIEFLAFFFLIKNHLVSSKIARALNSLLPIFLGIVLIYFIYYKSRHAEVDQYFLQVIFTIQALVLIAACIFYYMDLFRKEPKFNLTAQPSFWIVTGLAFFMLCTLPFSILGLYLMEIDFNLYVRLFIIFEVFYCLLFLMIIKAYLCKPATI